MINSISKNLLGTLLTLSLGACSSVRLPGQGTLSYGEMLLFPPSIEANSEFIRKHNLEWKRENLIPVETCSDISSEILAYNPVLNFYWVYREEITVCKNTKYEI